MTPAPTLRRLFPALAGALACACTAQLQKIEIEDHGAPSANVRAFFPLGEAERFRALQAGEREAALGWHHGIALEIEGTRGETEQDLDLGETVRLGEVDLVGPGLVRYDHELVTLNLSWVHGRVFDSGLALDLAYGLNATLLDLRAELAGVREEHDAQSVGPYVGLWLGWHSPWRLRPRLRLGFSPELPLDSEAREAESSVVELGLGCPLGGWGSLEAGWRWRDFESERGGASDLEIDIDGPFVGLVFGPY